MAPRRHLTRNSKRAQNSQGLELNIQQGYHVTSSLPGHVVSGLKFLAESVLEPLLPMSIDTELLIDTPFQSTFLPPRPKGISVMKERPKEIGLFGIKSNALLVLDHAITFSLYVILKSVIKSRIY